MESRRRSRFDWRVSNVVACEKGFEKYSSVLVKFQIGKSYSSMTKTFERSWTAAKKQMALRRNIRNLEWKNCTFQLLVRPLIMITIESVLIIVRLYSTNIRASLSGMARSFLLNYFQLKFLQGNGSDHRNSNRRDLRSLQSWKVWNHFLSTQFSLLIWTVSLRGRSGNVTLVHFASSEFQPLFIATIVICYIMATQSVGPGNFPVPFSIPIS